MDRPTETSHLLGELPLARVDNDVEDVEVIRESAEMQCHELAAWIIEWTMRGSPLESFESLPRTRAGRRDYLFFENTAWLRQLAVFGLIMLSFFELPSYCSAARKCVSADGSSLFLSGVSYLDSVWSQTLNASLLIVLVFFALFDLLAVHTTDLHGRARILRVLLLALVADAALVLAFGGHPPVRLAPYLRAMLPLFYWNSLRECTTAVAATVGPFANAFSIVALFTLVFGWLVTLLFHDSLSANPYFGNLTVGVYSAFTSLTTADWPIQIMAILDISRLSALLFLVFIVLGVFLLFNVLLAVVYNAYTEHLETLVVGKFRTRLNSLQRAHRVLVGAHGVCSITEMRQLFDELRRHKRHADLDEERIGMLFTALDEDKDGMISENEFLMLVEVLQLKFIVEMENESPMERWLPSVHASPLWTRLSQYVRSGASRYHMGIIMVVNVLVVLWETTMDLRNMDTRDSIRFFALLEVGFSVIYIVEMALKMLSQGLDRFWRDIGNRFDFIVTLLLLFGAGYVLYTFVENDPSVVRYFVLLRCLRLFAVLADVPRFRRIVQVFSLLIPASVPLFTFFALSLYVFAAAGVELFGGLIYAGNPALDPINSPLVGAFAGNDYWTLNFNDLASSWHTLFSTVIVGYITEIPEAISAASRFGDWTKWYFIVNFVVNSLIVSNCVIVFVVDLFVKEDEKKDNWIIDCNDLASRYGKKRVRVMNDRFSADQVYATMFQEKLEEVLRQIPS